MRERKTFSVLFFLGAGGGVGIIQVSCFCFFAISDA